MKCGICGCLLNETPETLDCGGDCLRCMAEVVQDPDSIKSINQLRNKGHHDMTKKPTIYEALKEKLGREPSNEELKQDCLRILNDGFVERMQLKQKGSK